MFVTGLYTALFSLCLLCQTLSAQVAVQAEVAKAGSYFEFESLPMPAVNDLGAKAVWKVAGGKADGNSAAITVLFDGQLPSTNDQPTQNFFFAAGSSGGLISVDLGAAQDITQVVSYSWHASTRAAQVYSLFAAVGDEPAFNIPDSIDAISKTSGWKKIADVDTRAAN